MLNQEYFTDCAIKKAVWSCEGIMKFLKMFIQFRETHSEKTLVKM